MSSPTADNGARSYSRAVIAVNAVVSAVVALGLVWLVNGYTIFYERLFRVQPTVEGGGIGADWVSGNEIGWLKIMVDAIHIVDIVLGVFILLMVFIHWGAFRRLASRMRQPGENRLAADGGVENDATAETPGGEQE
ncbi:hypothetical protein [Halolamina sp.]|jgi:uncharacterized membrane protein YqhA|uniref:hypothetical protein n=1 Tax=Halolamina sp. TaxID=1940283 RepID=UPI000223B6AB|nr:hypothetical protein Halar_1240 [halophilic archaeon DL31]